MLVFFFFKQKTAYEMRISDWSSDVCSSDLGALYLVPYHEEFAAEVQRAAALLEKAAVLAEDKGLRDYLELRAKALRTDLYRESDLAWLDMKDNTIGLVIGPIETYEDRLFGYKAAHEAYVLVKDRA